MLVVVRMAVVTFAFIKDHTYYIFSPGIISGSAGHVEYMLHHLLLDFGWPVKPTRKNLCEDAST